MVSESFIQLEKKYSADSYFFLFRLFQMVSLEFLKISWIENADHVFIRTRLTSRTAGGSQIKKQKVCLVSCANLN